MSRVMNGDYFSRQHEKAVAARARQDYQMKYEMLLKMKADDLARQKDKYALDLDRKKYRIALKRNNKHVHITIGKDAVPLTQEELNNIISDLIEVRQFMTEENMRKLLKPK